MEASGSRRGVNVKHIVYSLAVLSWLHAEAHAAPPRPAKAPVAAASAERASLETKLASRDPVVVDQALDEIRMEGPKAAWVVPRLMAMLDEGVSSTHTQRVLEALADFGLEESSPSIGSYCRHRDPRVRLAAVQALGATGGKAAAAPLRAALSDRDERVRTAAATALGTAQVRTAVGDLFRALERRNSGAAPALGAVCVHDECTKLVTYLGKLPFDTVSRGLERVFERPDGDVSEPEKLAVLGAIRELGTAECNTFLRALQSRFPEKGSKKLKQALDQAVLATAGGVK